MRLRNFAWLVVLLVPAFVSTLAQDRSGRRIITCSSDNGRYNLCQVPSISNATLRRQISGSPCVANRTWGFNEQGVWVDKGCRAEFEVSTRGRGIFGSPSADVNTIRCDSNDENYKFCPVPNLTRAELNRQVSGSPCTQGVTWGFRQDGIWVDRGCRAEFNVYSYGGYGGRSTNARTIRCNSDDEGFQFCSTGPITRAELTRQISGSPCRENYSWGYRHDGVWVDRGCRAEFEVYNDPWSRQREGRIVRCDSNDGGYKFCSTGPIRGAELNRQISGSPCQANVSWGYKRDGVWVNKGCRAEFQVYSWGARNDDRDWIWNRGKRRGRWGRTDTVRCESSRGYKFCPTDPLEDAELVRQLSDSECRFGRSWGYREDGIWVDRGCRGEFQVTGK